MNLLLRLGLCIAIVAAIVLGLSSAWAPAYVDNGATLGRAIYLKGVGFVIATYPRGIALYHFFRIPERIVIEASTNVSECSIYLTRVSSPSEILSLSTLSNASARQAVEKLIHDAVCEGRSYMRCVLKPESLEAGNLVILAICARGPELSIRYTTSIETPIAPCTNPAPSIAALLVGLALVGAGVYQSRQRSSRLRR